MNTINDKKIEETIRKIAKRILNENVPGQALVPAMDKNGNVSMVTPITADHIKTDPSLADKITRANGGQTASPTQPSQTTTSTGTPTPVSPVAQPNPTYNNAAANVNQNPSDLTEDNFVDPVQNVKEGKVWEKVKQVGKDVSTALKNPGDTLTKLGEKEWGYDENSVDHKTPKKEVKSALSRLGVSKTVREALLESVHNNNAYNVGNFNSFEDMTIGFEEIQEFASSPNNIYRNAAQRFLQELAWKKSAQSIVFLLKERGFLKSSISQEAIEDLHDVLTNKGKSNISAVIKENKLAVVTGFNLNDGDRKAYIVAEMWYTTDGHLRAINLKAFKNKGEKKEAYKDILKEDFQLDSFDNQIERMCKERGFVNVLDGLARYCSRMSNTTNGGREAAEWNHFDQQLSALSNNAKQLVSDGEDEFVSTPKYPQPDLNDGSF